MIIINILIVKRNTISRFISLKRSQVCVHFIHLLSDGRQMKPHFSSLQWACRLNLSSCIFNSMKREIAHWKR